MDLTTTIAPTAEPLLPTGEQYTITGSTHFGDAVVTITQVAAALRAFTVDGTDIVQRYPEAAVPSLGAGIVMAPWPNRVDHGLWSLDGVPQQLDITEPKFTNAIHGLLAHTAYHVVDQTASSITLKAIIYTAPGYPFVLSTAVTYTLDADGLTVQHIIENVGPGIAPVALGTHGYFMIGGVPTADLLLTNSARTVYENDARFLPVDRVPVSGRVDLRDGRPIHDLELDDCFTDQTATEGEYRTRLTAPDGRWVEVWTDTEFGHVVLLTTPHFIGADGHETLAVAIEPQTAAANAFNNGHGLRWLAPAKHWSARWGVRAQMNRDGNQMGERV